MPAVSRQFLFRSSKSNVFLKPGNKKKRISPIKWHRVRTWSGIVKSIQLSHSTEGGRPLSLSLLHSKVKVQLHNPELLHSLELLQQWGSAEMSFSICCFRAQTLQGSCHIFFTTSQRATFCRANQGPNQTSPVSVHSVLPVSEPISSCIPAVQWRNACRKCCLCDRELQRSQTSTREAQQPQVKSPAQQNNSLLHKVNSPSALKATPERKNNRWEVADCRNRARREKRVGFIAQWGFFWFYFGLSVGEVAWFIPPAPSHCNWGNEGLGLWQRSPP